MASSCFRSCWLQLFAIGLAVLLAPSGVRADANNSGTVNCGDENTKAACIECCAEVGCGLRITCCPLVGPCTVINKPSPTPLPLSLKDTSGGLKLQYVRKLSLGGADIALKVSFLKAVFPKALSLRAHLTGTDSQVGALLYPVLFLGAGDRAPDLLHALGYDVTITGTSPTCQSLFPGQYCTDLVLGLATRIEAALGGGIQGEAAAFEAGVAALGLATCETSTTTTTSTIAPSTTTTVVSGTSTTTMPCLFVSSGAAGVCGGSCPPGFSCLLNAPNGQTCHCVPDQKGCGSMNCAGQCPVQFERCEPLPDAPGCGCCTPTGSPCSATSVCCSGQSCDLATGLCPSPTTTTSASSTTTSSTTVNTTSTTLCAPGLTNCSGTCVNLSSDNNNCGFCGNVCPFNDPVCISSVCTIP
jgi:hypothetical protein